MNDDYIKEQIFSGYEDIKIIIEETISSNYEFYSKEELIEKVHEIALRKLEGEI